MKRHETIMLVLALVGCEPNYESGKTQCSDREPWCPDGYTCLVQGSQRLCFLGGKGGAGGNGGVKAGGGGGAGGTGGAIRDAGMGGSKDALATLCPIACPSGQQCFSGRCCPIPAAGGECNHLPSCGCLAGEVCYPSSSMHAMACYVSDNLSAGADCTGSTCAAGFGCFGGVCKAYCNKESDCSAVNGYASCDQTTWGSDKSSILGVMVCERICDPAHPQFPRTPLLPCPAGFNCSSDSTGISYCFKASPLPTGSTCAAEKDCPAGYYCSSFSKCQRYCLSNSDCQGGTTCTFTFSPPEYAAGIPVGYCS